jgi:hypothetical protein
LKKTKGVFTDMKKNKMMRTASKLLVLVMLTVSIICGTFAKYTVSATSPGSTATVAKWGVKISATGNLFNSSYPKALSSSSEISVQAGDASSYLVAPGTSNSSGVTFTIEGKPEVATTLTFKIDAQDIYLAAGNYGEMQKVEVTSATFSTLKSSGLYTTADSGKTYSKVTDDSSYDSSGKTTYYELINSATVGEGGYYPVRFECGDVTDKTAQELALALAKKIKSDTTQESGTKVTYAVSEDYNANADLSETELGSNTIKWAWAYEGADGANDAADTILGDLINGNKNVVTVASDGGKATQILNSDGIVKAGFNTYGSVKVSLAITITATQID